MLCIQRLIKSLYAHIYRTFVYAIYHGGQPGINYCKISQLLNIIKFNFFKTNVLIT